MTILERVRYDFSGRVAVVTGAGRGIGRGIAEAVADAGAEVALIARTETEIEQAAAEITEATGRRTLAIPCDVSKNSEVEAMVERVVTTFGAIDILVNNAGITIRHSAFELDEDEWDRVVEVNFKSAYLVSRAAARHMVARKYGRIVNVASGAAELTLGNATAYGPSKAGMVGLTRQLASEWAKLGITVNAVSPWMIKTALNADVRADPAYLARIEARSPAGRTGEISEIVAPVMFLSSDDASFVTGQNLYVDGGALRFGF